MALTEKRDVTKSVEWKMSEGRLDTQIVDDIQILADAGLGDFVLAIRDKIQRARHSIDYARRDGWLCCFSDVVQTAVALGFSEESMTNIAAWRKYRQPVLGEIAREVRAEVERLRRGARRRGAA